MTVETGETIDLLDHAHLDHWKPAGFGGQGEYSVSRDGIELDFGYTMTGVVYNGELPNDDYQISYQARRIDGTDFFGTITFPVAESHCSFVLGGWGGATIGLSCLDNEDASQNETKDFVSLDADRWYDVRVDVALPVIQCFIDGKKVVDVDVSGKQVDVRPDVAVCRPLGFCAYETRAEIRNVRLSRLPKR